MSEPWVILDPIDPARFVRIRLRAIFECDRWDPQVGDRCALSPQPLAITASAWAELTRLAEALAAETQAAEDELLADRKLRRRLALPRPIERALRQGRPTPSLARVMRFDFHWATDGWRISECNSDVPGGYIESSGFGSLVSEACDDAPIAGDVAGSVARAVADRLGVGRTVALVHATAYTDDRQVMCYLSRRLRAGGLRTVLTGPDLGAVGPIDAAMRFFPAEWLPALERGAAWRRYFSGVMPVMNPGHAILTQTKRFPLTWDRLATPLPTWRSLLPETRDPRDISRAELRSGQWLLKPALGRVGEGIARAGGSDARTWRRVRRDAWWNPRDYVAQRRFDTLPLETAAGSLYPCVGVFTVNGRTAGAYGRLGTTPIIDNTAQDAAVLVTTSGRVPAPRKETPRRGPAVTV